MSVLTIEGDELERALGHHFDPDGAARALVQKLRDHTEPGLPYKLALFSTNEEELLITTDDEQGVHLPDNGVQCSVCRRNTQ